jgi:hypothetical protein
LPRENRCSRAIVVLETPVLLASAILPQNALVVADTETCSVYRPQEPAWRLNHVTVAGSPERLAEKEIVAIRKAIALPESGS